MRKLNYRLGYFQLISFLVILLLFSVYKISEGMEEAVYTIPFAVALLFPFVSIAFLAIRNYAKETGKLHLYLNAALLFLMIFGSAWYLSWATELSYGYLLFLLTGPVLLFLKKTDLKLLLFNLLGCVFLFLIGGLVFARYLQFSLF